MTPLRDLCPGCVDVVVSPWHVTPVLDTSGSPAVRADYECPSCRHTWHTGWARPEGAAA